MRLPSKLSVARSRRAERNRWDSRNAESIAAMVLTTEALITDMPEKGTPAPMPQMPED